MYMVRMKKDLKEIAITLRKNGNSYSEILSIVPVAKSTLSLWLRSIGLSKKQKQRLTEKKIASIKRGNILWKQHRLDKTQQLITTAAKEVGNLTVRELWLIGVALYWAEGAKEKEYNVSQRVLFSNSDPRMICLFLSWLQKCIAISIDSIGFEIYLHESAIMRKQEIIEYWAAQTGLDSSCFGTIYLKKNKLSPHRRKTGTNYFGLVRVKVNRSTDLNRRITGWVAGLYEGCRVV